MKLFSRIITLFAASCLLICSSGCSCNHEFAKADCVTPKTCIKCGATEGEPLGHKWIEADCVNPEKCSVCGAVEGNPLGHTPGEWEKADEAIIGGKVQRKCSVCGEIIETQYEEKGKKSSLDLFSSEGLALFCRDFMKRLAEYLPEGVAVCTDERNNPDNMWFTDGSMFSVMDIEDVSFPRYIRFWYADSKGFSDSQPYEEHIDAYFDTTDDFIGIAPYLFEAVDSEFVKTDRYKEAINSMELIMRNTKTTGKDYYLKMTSGYFICSYTQPYDILGEWHPGYYGIRFVSAKFFNKISKSYNF